jgi:hypothetical protein
VSPILVRPVREQLAHDRIIRLLVPRYKRRFMVTANPGAEQNLAVGEGAGAYYPDLVLMPQGRSRKPAGVVEVETQESVNNLEAIAQWAIFGRQPSEFALYVPANSVEVTKRLCADNQIGVTEIWTYYEVGDQLRFTLVFRSPVELKVAAARAAASAAAAEKREAERLEQAAKRAASRKKSLRNAVRSGAKKPATPAKSARPAKPSTPTMPAKKATSARKR